MPTELSIIVPVLGDAEALRASAPRLLALRSRGAQVVVVDGGSRDDTLAVARACADLVISTDRGRATQMNAGARHALGDTLLFLHADTRLPADAERLIERALASPTRSWGRFDVRIEPATPLLALVARAMNLRSRLSGIATGDQAIFVRRCTFEQLGGYPEIALMEDVAFSQLAKRTGPPVCLKEKVTTSARRWQTHGVARTIALMWYLRLAYFLGADTNALAKRYGYAPRTS
jgi:rSAM/selenodomain-associated transferase 2